MKLNWCNGLCDCLRECRKQFCRRPTAPQAAALFVTIAAFAAVIALAATGHLQALADRIAELGWSGHLIFCALLIYTGLVFGYGWTFFAVATGYTFGWWALITIHIGTALGAALGFLSSRYWLQSLVEQKVASLPAHWSARVLVMQHEVSSSTLGFFLWSALLRWTGLTFGICNAIVAALTSVGLPTMCVCTIVALEPAIVLDVYLGNLLRDVSSGEADAARQRAVGVQIGIACSLLILASWYARWRVRKATSAASHGLPSVRSDPSSGASQPPSAADPAASPTAKLATGDNSSHAQFPASIEAV